MGIFKAFSKANEVIEQSRREVAKGKKSTKDEVAAKRQQKNQGGKK